MCYFITYFKFCYSAIYVPKCKYFMKIKSFLLVFSSILMLRSGLSMMYHTHTKCRGGLYPRSNVERFPVPDDKVRWKSLYLGYNPPSYTSPSIHGQIWADPDIGDQNFHPKWNTMEQKVNRKSYLGDYEVVKGFPKNPIGRTGIVGRGVLGRWGPNHAADPIVTRWKKTSDGQPILNEANLPILQFVAIKRQDTGEWALPGGMVDPGEMVAATAVREFQEEATNSLGMSKDEKDAWLLEFHKFFKGGEIVYSGYIDDPRNTDNAWMESVAYNFHDNDGSIVGKLNLRAGDDAVGVRWVDAEPNMTLYASHKNIILDVMNKHLSIPMT